MVKVKLFGTLRIDSGIKELDIEADSVRKLYEPLYSEILKINPDPGFTLKELKDCIIAVNGRRVNKNTALSDGDEVLILTAAGGG